MNASELASHLPLITFWAFALGCCIGSFMNVVVWRLPRGENLSYPPSHCPKCGHAIRPWENIPLISWLCLRGRCSACHLPISVKYPLGEAATGLLFTAVWLSIYRRALPLAVVLPYFALTANLLAASLIDAEHRFIPDKVNYSGLVLAFAFALAFPSCRLALLPDERHVAGRLIFTGARQLLRNLGVPALSPTAAALLDCALGAAFGFAIIFLFAQLIKLLLPCRALPVNLSKGIRISKDALEMNGKSMQWEELLNDDDDVITVHGRLKGGESISKITANAKSCFVDGNELDHTKPIRVTAKRILMPNEPMGWGDIKLMAMIGAFLGADASIYILFAGAMLGLLAALLHSVVKRRLKPSMPFAPPLAIAALLWMLLGKMP